jgi:hypothetical protein
MAGYLNQNTLDAIGNSFAKLHETFAKTIYVFKNGKKTVIATNAKYNSIYGKTNTGTQSGVQYATIKQEFSARIYYNEEDQEFLGSEGNQDSTQNKIILPKGSVRIVVEYDAYLFLKEARRVEVDGRVFAIKSGGGSVGFETNRFYHFHLTSIDE